MIILRSLLIALGIFFLVPKNTTAQKQWSLQECIDYANKKNIQIQQSELNSQSALNNYQQSYGNFVPTLNGNATHFYNFGQTIDRYTNQFIQGKAVQSNNFGVSSSLTLFNGGQNVNTLRQNQANLAASRFDVDKSRNDVALNIASAYLQILFNDELLKIAQSQILLTEQQLKRTQALYNAGSVSKEALLNIESQKASEELSVVTAQNALDISYLTLSQLMDLDSVSDFRIQKPEITIPEKSLINSTTDQIISAALTSRPEIRSAELKVESAHHSLNVARAGISPTLSLTGSIGTGYSGQRKDIISATESGRQITGYAELLDPNTGQVLVQAPTYTPTFSYDTKVVAFDKQVKDNVNKTVGFNLSIPIVNNFQVKNNIQRAKINKKNAELTLELTENNLRKTIQQAYADATASLKKYQANEKAVIAMRETFKFTEQKFNVGSLNSFDYNNAKTRLLKSEADLLQAKYDYVFKTKILEFYQGKPITIN